MRGYYKIRMAYSSSSLTQLKISKVWPLERYARLLQEKEHLFPQPQATKIQSTGGSWKHYSSSSDWIIRMALVDDNHLTISGGNQQIYESISLWEAKKWMHGVTKGDSALFIYKLKDENRRFRVKFSPMTSGGSSFDACKQCSTVLSSFITMSEMPTPAVTHQVADKERTSQHLPSSQVHKQLDASTTKAPEPAAVTESGAPSKGSKLMPISEIAQTVQCGGKSLGRAYASTNFPTEQLGSFIRLCLTDANFPAFVETVEEELNNITNRS